MKKLHLVMYSALLLLFCSAWSQAQGLASTRNSNSKAGGQVVSDVTGAGTTNYVPLWLSGTELGSSTIFQSSGAIGIGTTVPAATLDVNGTINAATGYNLGGQRFAYGTVGNTFLGFSAGNATMTGGSNTGIGLLAFADNTTGSFNTAIGEAVLEENTTGGDNTGIGAGGTLTLNTTGNANTAVGWAALAANTTGSANTASGAEALYRNTTGINNTANGWGALSANTTGSNNTASGLYSLIDNTTGSYNTASGVQALYSNTTGSYNTASGFYALLSNTTGGDNVALGYGALYSNTTGTNNTAVGEGAGPDSKSTNLTFATAIGAGAVVSESNALVLGGPLGSGYNVKVGIGTATPANVFTIAQGAGAAISDGWATYSSRRWKTNIQTLHNALSKVEQLRGVSYDLQANGKHEVGVIAEEVGAVVPEVVTWDKNGKDAQSVDYSRLTALLIEATKEQQTLIREQQEQIKTQQAQITQLVSQVKTIRASLETSDQSSSEVRTIKADLATVRQ